MDWVWRIFAALALVAIALATLHSLWIRTAPAGSRTSVRAGAGLGVVTLAVGACLLAYSRSRWGVACVVVGYVTVSLMSRMGKRR